MSNKVHLFSPVGRPSFIINSEVMRDKNQTYRVWFFPNPNPNPNPNPGIQIKNK